MYLHSLDTTLGLDSSHLHFIFAHHLFKAFTSILLLTATKT